MSRFLDKRLQGLAPYTPGEQPQTGALIKLNTNENPYPPSPQVKEAVSRMDQDDLRLYPDPETRAAILALGQYYDLAPEQITLGNGSDELLAFAYMAYGGKVYYPTVTYGFYPVFGEVFHCQGVPVPMAEGFRIDPADYGENDGLIMLANPNAPTGLAMELSDIETILDANRDQVVVVDEAYVDFGTDSCVPLIADHDNLLVVMTFSKSRSLAGMRIGYAMGHPDLINDIDRIRFSFNPYNLSRGAIVAARAAIEDDDYFQLQRKKIMDTRQWFCEELDRLGFSYLPSTANFVFVETGEEYFEKLRERGILVRHWDVDPIRDYLRITVGKDEEMKKLITALEEIQGGENVE